MKIIETKEEYERLWKKNQLSILQSWEWGEVKKPEWKPYRLDINGRGVQLLVRKFPLLNKYFGYIPRGLNLETFSPEILSKLKNELKKHVKLTHLLIDFNLKNELSFHQKLEESGLKRAGESIQPNQTMGFDLSQGEEKVFEKLQQSKRRATRKAVKLGCVLEVYKSGEEPLNRFWNIMKTILSRTEYVMHPKAYFQKVWKNLAPPGKAKILIVTKDGKDLAAYMLFYDERNAYELYGGATNEGNKLKAGSFLKWQAILDAIKSGKKYYDMWGVAPFRNENFDKKHQLFQISLYKQSFGGEYFEFLPQYTLVFNDFWYKIYKFLTFVSKLHLKSQKKVRV